MGCPDMMVDYEALPVAESWYSVDSYPGDITRLREIHIDPYWAGSVWLVQGSERDLVVDSGTGIVPLAPLIAEMTPRPVLAVALCSNFDHSSGFYSFDERACHALEAEALTHPKLRDLSDYLGIENRLLAVPKAGFRLEDYVLPGAAPTRLLEDGDIIDLGNRKFEVLHIPGRTPASLALWEAATGYLFGGETLFIDPDKRDFPAQVTADYEASLKRLGELAVTTVFGGHYSSFSADELTQLIEAEIGRYE